jgi:hypothetical protein
MIDPENVLSGAAFPYIRVQDTRDSHGPPSVDAQFGTPINVRDHRSFRVHVEPKDQVASFSPNILDFHCPIGQSVATSLLQSSADGALSWAPVANPIFSIRRPLPPPEGRWRFDPDGTHGVFTGINWETNYSKLLSLIARLDDTNVYGGEAERENIKKDILGVIKEKLRWGRLYMDLIIERGASSDPLGDGSRDSKGYFVPSPQLRAKWDWLDSPGAHVWAANVAEAITSEGAKRGENMATTIALELLVLLDRFYKCTRTVDELDAWLKSTAGFVARKDGGK